MKRMALHLTFWTLYLLQDSLLVFTWVGPSLGTISDARLIGVSLSAALVMLIPKLLLTYFILLYSIRKIGSVKYQLRFCAIEIFLALVISIILYRVLTKYYVNPVLYNGMLKNSPFFSIRGILMALMDIGFVTGLAVAIKFIRFQLVAKKKEMAAKEREKCLVKEKLEAELKFLRNQTNPHFLMNTLNNIYALARKKSEETAEVVMKLSELLRFMLYESDEHFISLTDEIKVLEDYLELEKIRYNKRLTVTFSKEIDRDSYLITPFLLLPFVENAFKHGISETRFESFIHIDLKVHNDQLTFLIENSKDAGNGHILSNNIGLQNVKRQLELVYKDYQLDARNGDTTYKVKLALNLDNYVAL